MGLSDIEVVKEMYRCFAEKDYDQLRKTFAPDIVWVQMPGFPGGGTYRGADDIFKHVFGKFKVEWKDWKAMVTDFSGGKGFVLATGYYEGTFIATSKFVKAEFAHMYRISDGKIVKFQQYTDTFLINEAMKA